MTVLSFTIAGLVALCGVNSAGVSVWCNAVYQLSGSPKGLPVAFVVRHVLSQPTLAQAQAFVSGVEHATGQNYLLGGTHGLVSFECSAARVVETRGSPGPAWHTNHPVGDPASADADSLARDSFLGRALAQASTADDLKRILEDRSVPVCKAGPTWQTLWAVVVEHRAPPRVSATMGAPSPTAWTELPMIEAPSSLAL